MIKRTARKERHGGGPVKCSNCNTDVIFAVLVATMHLRHFRQVTANNWKRVAADPRRFHFRRCIVALCGSCGQAFDVPSSLEAAVAQR